MEHGFKDRLAHRLTPNVDAARPGLRHSPAHRFHHELSQVGLGGDMRFPGISFVLMPVKRATHCLVHTSLTWQCRNHPRKDVLLQNYQNA